MRFLKGLIIAVCMTVTCSAQAALLSVKGPAQVTTGQHFSVDIVVSGLESIDLSAYDFEVNFDASILSFNSYTLGTSLTDPVFGMSDLSRALVSAGKVNLAEVSFLLDFTAQASRFVVATLNFTAQAAGVSQFTLDPVDAADGLAQTLLLNANGTQVSVTAVAAPSSLWLLTFVPLVVLAHRQRQRS